MDISSSWGCQCHPKKYSRGTSVKAWGCPCIPSSSIKIPGHLSMSYIFIASYTMCYSWSVFIFFAIFFSFLFVLFAVINGWTPSFLVMEETHSVLIAQNTLVFTFIVPQVFQFAYTLFSSCFSCLFMFRAFLSFVIQLGLLSDFC